MIKKLTFIMVFLITIVVFPAITRAMPNSSTILICALSSFASYTGDPNELVLSMLDSRGWTIEPIHGKFKNTDVRAFVISKPDANLKIVSICGTEDATDAMIDLRFGKIDYRDGLQVHRGFLNYSDDFLSLTRDTFFNDPTEKIILTGHSLGGAVAILSAARLIDAGLPAEKIEVVTFGAPAVGEKNFADEFADKFKLTRFEMKNDPITKTLQPLGYTKFGEAVTWKPSTRKMPHSMSLYLDCAIRKFYDDPFSEMLSNKKTSQYKIRLSNVEIDSEMSRFEKDLPYVRALLSDEIDSNNENYDFSIDTHIQVLTNKEVDEDFVIYEEIIYDSNQNLVTMHSISTSLADLTFLETAGLLQEKLRENRDAIFEKSYSPRKKFFSVSSLDE